MGSEKLESEETRYRKKEGRKKEGPVLEPLYIPILRSTHRPVRVKLGGLLDTLLRSEDLDPASNQLKDAIFVSLAFASRASHLPRAWFTQSEAPSTHHKRKVRAESLAAFHKDSSVSPATRHSYWCD